MGLAWSATVTADGMSSVEVVNRHAQVQLLWQLWLVRSPPDAGKQPATGALVLIRFSLYSLCVQAVATAAGSNQALQQTQLTRMHPGSSKAGSSKARLEAWRWAQQQEQLQQHI